MLDDNHHGRQKNSHTEHKHHSALGGGHTGRASMRLSDLQVLQGIDSVEDPGGRYALRKIDFTRRGVGTLGKKEFQSKDEALRALE